ncbi:hypothetical protein P5673_015384 [Acropora cervicornis]|uniref:THAP-type domain-containing protein n=1 Tax=Acropora cervicornis TaxID=6130 RepID=A0AAD9QIN1_ACRCE|nr:hypothetical protein P5673_015384 [Acropora cervicornis]
MRESVVVLCIIGNCGSKSGRDSIRFYSVPSIITNQGEEFEELTRERRNLWISAIDRADLKTKNVLKNERVCSRHFVSGRPAANWDRFNEDWVPTLHLTKKEYKKKDVEAARERSERAKARRKSVIERQEEEAVKKRKFLNESGERILGIDFTALRSTSPSESEENREAMMLDEPCASGEQNETNTASLVSTAITMDVETQTEEQSGTTRMDAETQTEEFDYLLNARPSGYHAPDKEFFDMDEMMDARLSPLVSWPDRERLWRTMPVSFQYAFGKQVTVIIDCFEVFIERPTNLLARAQTFSNYKHHNTIKILIGITPQGTICFVSEAWGGRTSDKYLTENCGFLENLLPGDMVMADRGFTICESVGLKQAKLVIPAFTKGKSQLHPVDVERTRGIASVRIHVERVIGLLRQKYTILEGPLPTDFLSSNRSGTSNAKTPMIDQIIRVCSALVNLCPPIIPFD